MIELPKEHRNERKNENIITNYLIEIDGINYRCEETRLDEKCHEVLTFISRFLDIFIYRGDYTIENVKISHVEGYTVYSYELINEEGSGIPSVKLVNRISENADKEKRIVFNGNSYDSYEEVLCQIEKMIDELIQ